MSAPTPPDPHRIKRILNKLERVWETMPDKDISHVLFVTRLSMISEFGLVDEYAEKCLDDHLKDHSLSGWKS